MVVNGSVDQGTADAGQSVIVTAVDKLHTFTLGGGAAGGLVGVAGGIDIGVVKVDTRAWIGEATHVTAKNDVGVYALAKKDVLTLAISAAGGFVGVSGSVSVWSIGSNSSGRYDDGYYDASKERGNWDAGTLYTEGDIVTGIDGNKYAARDLTDDADGNSGNGYTPTRPIGDNPAAWAEISQDKFNSEAVATPSNNKGAWSSATTYAAGNLVTRSGKYYRANGATTNDDPATQADKWGRIDDDSLSTENGSAQQQSGDSASGSDPNNGYRTIINGTSDNTPDDDDPTAAKIRAAQTDRERLDQHRIPERQRRRRRHG